MAAAAGHVTLAGDVAVLDAMEAGHARIDQLLTGSTPPWPPPAKPAWRRTPGRWPKHSPPTWSTRNTRHCRKLTIFGATGTYLIEQRWRERFGDATIDELRQALSSVADPAGISGSA